MEIEYKFTHHSGEEHVVQLVGLMTNHEGLRTFEKCKGDYWSCERFQVLLSSLHFRKELSEFLIKKELEQ